MAARYPIFCSCQVIILQEHGGPTAGAIVRARGAHEDVLVAVTELPFCHGGAAHHNVENALAAAALACALGLPDMRPTSGRSPTYSSAQP